MGKSVQSENEALREKVIDLEARSRRQNIKIVGLPEKIENGHPTEFLTKFITDLLGTSNFLKPLEEDQAHRLGRQFSGEDSRPRVMIARVHHFEVKEKNTSTGSSTVASSLQGQADTHFSRPSG